MNTRKSVILLLMSAALTCYANKKAVENDARTSDQTEMTVVTDNFDKISTESYSKIVFTQGKKCNVKIVSDHGISRYPQIIVENNTLTIKKDYSKCTIYVEAPDLKSVISSGYSNITVSSLKTKNLEITMSGNTTMKLGDIKCDRFTFISSGFTNVSMSGLIDARIVTLKYSGNSIAKFMKIKADSVFADYSGFCSQKVDIACKYIDFNVHGNVSFSGNVTAEKMNIDSHGFSKIDLNQNGNEVTLKNHGNTIFKVNLNCKFINAQNSGFGNMILTGIADSTKINSSGNSRIDIRNLNKF